MFYVELLWKVLMDFENLESTILIIIIIMCKYSWLYNHTNIIPTSYFTRVNSGAALGFEEWVYYTCMYNEKQGKYCNIIYICLNLSTYNKVIYKKA